MKNISGLFSEQNFNGTYKITPKGLIIAEKIDVGTKLEVNMVIKTVSEVYKDLPNIFYFKCSGDKNKTYGIENITHIAFD